LSHPNPESYNHALAGKTVDTLKKTGHDVIFHDLYAEQFDPVLPKGEEHLPEPQLPPVIQNYLREFKEAEGIVFLHPNWWGSPPAVLRGWIERIVRTNSCYNFTESGVRSYVGGKIVQIFSTSNTPKEIEEKVYGDPIETYWRTVVFGVLGCRSFSRRNFGPIIVSTPEERRTWLNEAETIMKEKFAL
jgi:putative NADPH-quinone reductase